MKYDMLSIASGRSVTLAGSTKYFAQDMHPDRVMREHDLMYMLEGDWSICQDEENYQLKKGDLIFLRAGSHHYSLTPCSPNTQTMYVHFSALPEDRYGVDVTSALALQMMQGDMLCIPTFTNCLEHPSIRITLQAIAERYLSAREDRERSMRLLLDVLLSDIAHCGHDNQIHGEDWVMRILRLMHTNPTHMFSLEEIAQQASTSVRTLSTRFRRATGQSVYRYQLNLKLDMALALIRSEPHRKIADIAVHFGFYDAYQFSKLFKKKFFFPPRHFQRTAIGK